MVDYSLLYVPALSIDEPQQLLRTEPKQIPFQTTGSPRCVWPLVTKPFDDARRYHETLITGQPNAIGGQSGSSIYDTDRNAVALLTWSISGRAAGQTTESIYLVATHHDVAYADRRPIGLQELQTAPQRALTDEGTQATVAVSIQDLPIWTDGGSPTDPQEPPGEPDCPPCCCCGTDPSQTAADWRALLKLLLELIRLLTEQQAASL